MALKNKQSKIVAMIPARMGSQRIPKKNIRLLGGKPLIAYAIEAAQKAQVFDEIYVNSESDILGKIAEQWNVRFYKRPAYLSSDKTVNDEFLTDFMQNIKGDVLVQLLPTSPLITAEEISDFVHTMLKECYDTLVSVVNHQIACVYQGKPVNFDLLERHKSSQNMIPVQSYASVLMAWQYKKYFEHLEKYGCAYYGAAGKIGYYPLQGLSTIDIDHEEDFTLAEVAMAFSHNRQQGQQRYYEFLEKAKP